MYGYGYGYPYYGRTAYYGGYYPSYMGKVQIVCFHRMSSVTPQAPTATVGLDVDGDGRADYLVTGADRNLDGIPDALQARIL